MIQGVGLSPSAAYSFSYNDIVVPRIGEELTFGHVTYRLGYSFKPTIMKALPTGAGNYLDPDRHSINAGVGFSYHHFFGFDIPTKVDLHISYDMLASAIIAKTGGATGPNEAGTANDPLIGYSANGYSMGGNLVGGGVSLNFAF